VTSSLRDLKVYTTYPHECSYLEDKEATTLFVDPRTEVDDKLYSDLSALGFRRSGSHLYRPHCQRCNACIPARIRVADFKPRRNQRRTWQRNQDLRVEQVSAIDGDDHFDLYCRYIAERHQDGDMFPPLRDQYLSFLSDEWGVTEYYQMLDQDRLVGVAVVDRINDGLSAIYTFFDPDLPQRSLGVYSILWQQQKALAEGVPYLYLGYWIRDCQKMSYKTQYRPLELLINGRWVDLL
jgi:arginyl-tRNA--protein-N-Asp/Glu arginylyltransferase